MILVSVNMFYVNQHTLRDTDITKLLTNCKHSLHTAADYDDFAATENSCLYHLLETVNVRCKCSK
ncbi:hypothetical protein D3C73_1611830 [compost metagenome]